MYTPHFVARQTHFQVQDWMRKYIRVATLLKERELGSWIASLENVPQAALILELSRFIILTIQRQADRL